MRRVVEFGRKRGQAVYRRRARYFDRPFLSTWACAPIRRRYRRARYSAKIDGNHSERLAAQNRSPLSSQRGRLRTSTLSGRNDRPDSAATGLRPRSHDGRRFVSAFPRASSDNSRSASGNADGIASGDRSLPTVSFRSGRVASTGLQEILAVSIKPRRTLFRGFFF